MSKGNDSSLSLKPALGEFFSTPEGLVRSPKGNIFSIFGDYTESTPKSSEALEVTHFALDEDPSPVAHATSDPDYIRALTGESKSSSSCDSGKDSA